MSRLVISAIQGLDDPKSNPTATDRDGNRNLIIAAKAAGVDHFVLVSVVKSSPDHPMSLGRAKYAAEQFLKSRGLAWTIVRGTAYMEFWAKLVGQPLIDKGRTQVFGRGDNRSTLFRCTMLPKRSKRLSWILACGVPISTWVALRTSP